MATAVSIVGNVEAITRRRFFATTALIAGAAPLASCSTAGVAYEAAAKRTWSPFAGAEPSGHTALARELVRYATLAPSSHNTQCWTFALERERMTIAPDLRRRCPAVDPDDHHLFVSLGCATENMVIAGSAHGLRGSVHIDEAHGDAVHVDFEPTRPDRSLLFDAIPQRGCSRAEYDGKPLASAELRQLERAGEGNGVHVMLLTARDAMERVLSYVLEGNSAQMNDGAFMNELRKLIRFSDAEAVRKRDGLFSRASGSPSVPRWLASPLFGLFFNAKSQNEQYAKFLRSSAGIAVFVSDTADKRHWVETGRCYVGIGRCNVRIAFPTYPSVPKGAPDTLVSRCSQPFSPIVVDAQSTPPLGASLE